jgi:RNA polymerase primary sigma factor
MTDHALALYLDDVRSHPLLSAGEELRLGRLSAAGDQTARRRLVECNLPLVVAIARRYRGMGLDLLDLIQEGNVGLIAAAERYDWTREASFATYASRLIRREICRALSARSRLIRLPLRTAESATRVKRTERELVQRLGRRPADAELARAAGVDERIVADLRRADLPTVSLSEPGGGDELDAAYSAAQPDEAVDCSDALAAIGERARRILELRYGLDGRQPRTLDEVAGELGISRQRVRTLEARTLLELRSRQAALGAA